MIDLYTWGTPNGHKISIMLEETGLPYTVHAVDIGNGEQHTPAFQAINPNKKIPAIVDHLPDGDLTIFESGAILIHLAERAGHLIPTDPARRMQCYAWLFWQVGGLGPMVGQWGYFKRQKEAPNLPALKRYFDESMRLFKVLDDRLAEAEYLAVEYSIADIANFTWAKAGLQSLRAEQPDAAEQFVNIRRWLGLVEARPAVRKGMKIPA